ncbi:MAG TPA: vWA domain-containing protein [Polyangiaceae bacterium]|nr:vWA domain-containing protein [Polyangiaceae bacterium]
MKYSPFLLSIAVVLSASVIACSSDDDGDGGSTADSGSTDSDTTSTDTADSDSADSDTASTDSADSDTASTDSADSDSADSDTADTDTGSTSNDDEGNSACGLANGDSGFFGNADINDIAELESCGGETREVESVAADIFILLDKSTSMNDHRISDDPNAPTRWEALTTSLKDFFVDAGSQNLRVGLQYFGLQATSDSSSSDQGLSCDPEEYANPDVEIDSLADNSDDLVDSINDHSADSLTPTHPALEGALMYTKQWAIDHPDRPAVLVLATDGYPTVCDDTSISGLEDLVEEYANPTDDSPAVPTFVLGVGEVSNLERVAAKGGTGRAFFVADCPTATEDLLAALKRVANSPAACEFDLPEPDEGGQIVNCDKVNVIYQQNGADITESIPHVDSLDDCGGGNGWYYSDDTCTPGETQIHICPSSCGKLGGGSVRLVLGCDQIELN